MNGFEGAVSYLQSYKGRPITIMEVCGTHTATAFKGGIRSLIPPDIRLISGPGCPVCLASAAYIDRLIELALEKDHIVASFGDLMKVKGTNGSLNDAKAAGGNVELVYSPLEALDIARENPKSTVVMAAVGFETTAPLYALLVRSATEQGIRNIKLLTALKRMPPALHMLCAEDIDAFIAPGHVAAIIGSEAFTPLAKRFQKPFAVAGFTPEGMLAAIYSLVRQVENGTCAVENLYGEVVRPRGNEKALLAIQEYFQPGPAFWRGFAGIAYSGLYLKEEYGAFDAGSTGLNDTEEATAGCHCAEVLTGRMDPKDCPLFGKACTPQSAKGPCMVSAEGACGIWYREGEPC
jgi:hydrogenase expression/formation protein HypD